MNYAYFKLEEKTTTGIKKIKTILSMLQETNSPWLLDEENW